MTPLRPLTRFSLILAALALLLAACAPAAPDPQPTEQPAVATPLVALTNLACLHPAVPQTLPRP